MLKKYLLYMLIALVALQSIDAMADAVKFHQPNSEFTELDYFSDNYLVSGSSEKSSLISENDTLSDDADHCCYCHGISNMLFTSEIFHTEAISLTNKINSLNQDYLSQLVSPDLRPPIAHV